MRHRPSVADVARRAQVSVGTVSNVLNRPDRVAPPTRSRVEKAIAELGFVPSASARQLRAGVGQTVGAVVLDLGSPFFTSIARGIEDRLAPEDLALLISSSDGSPSREQHFLRLHEQHSVRGVLVTPASSDLSELEAIRSRGTTVVLLDADGGDFPSVSVDDVHGGRIAVGHLLAQGHERVTFINGPHSIHQCVDRETGARAAITDAGLDPDEVLTVLRVDHLNAEAGAEIAEQLLELTPARRPSAIFCVNDLVALGVLRTLLRAGVQVPSQVAVVGYDDVAFAGMLMVPLTTVRQPTHDIGWAAADLLLRLDGESTTGSAQQRVHFTPELVVRLSSSPTATD